MTAEKKTKLIMHYLPPADTSIPSASFSVLQGFMEANGYGCQIIYWNNSLLKRMSNITLFPSGRVAELDVDTILLTPFLTKIARSHNSGQAEQRLAANLMSLSPELTFRGGKGCSDFLNEIETTVFTFLEEEVAKIPAADILLFCFSAKFCQWIPALPLAEMLKRQFPKIKTAIGGFGNEREAKIIMAKCRHLDFAVWGEGEYPLLHLVHHLEDAPERIALAAIPRLIYRTTGGVAIAKAAGGFVNFADYSSPEYGDFLALENSGPLPAHYATLILEAARGCHWNRCKFCALNSGYSYRTRSAESIVREIETMSARYRRNDFFFLDTDLVGKDSERFEALLEQLIALSNKSLINYKFSAEINPHGLNARIIKKMALAGLRWVQIGYEAISDSLLKRMDKKSDFADLLLFAKFATKYGIRIEGANIIRGIVGETEQDVRDSMENLAYLRFFLGRTADTTHYSHYLHKLKIYGNSRFYAMLTAQELPHWNTNAVHYLLPENFLADDERFVLFGFEGDLPNKAEWEQFAAVNKYYEESNYRYNILEHDGIYYFEQYLNGEVNKHIVFDEPEYIEMLKIANNEVTSLSALKKALAARYPKISQARILAILEELKAEFLLYFNNDKTRIISVIDLA